MSRLTTKQRRARRRHRPLRLRFKIYRAEVKASKSPNPWHFIELKGVVTHNRKAFAKLFGSV